MKKILSLALSAAMLMMTLAGCGGASAAPSGDTGTASSAADAASAGEVAASAAGTTDTGAPVYGGSVTMYFNNLGTDYDPAAPDFENYMLWYERLWSPDWANTSSNYTILTTDNVSGQIADTWDWDASAKKLTVNIRQDVTFQKPADSQYDYYGGRGLVAADVKWSYERLLGIGDFSEPVQSMMDWTSTLSMLDSIETDGDYTVIFNFNTDSEVALNNFITAPVCIAGHEWGELSEEQRSDWHYACGTGPYIISDYDESNNMTLVKNENYYDYDERYPENKLPYLDSVSLVKVDDTATLMAEFIAGQVDFIGNTWAVFSSSEAEQIAAGMDASAYNTFPQANGGRAIAMKQTVEPLKNEKVREALQHAINIEEVATRYFNMTDWTLPTLFAEDTGYSSRDEWDDALVSSFDYDPELAKSMLAEAGYADGFSFDFTYVDSGNATDLYLLIQQYLAAVGVTMNIQAANDHASYISSITAEDGTLCGVASCATNSIAMIPFCYHSGGVEYLMGGEDKLDALVDALSDATTMEEYVSDAKAIDKYIAEQHLTLVVGPTETMDYFVNSKVGGYHGENMYASWNCGTILARIWSITGA